MYQHFPESSIAGATDEHDGENGRLQPVAATVASIPVGLAYLALRIILHTNTPITHACNYIFTHAYIYLHVYAQTQIQVQRKV